MNGIDGIDLKKDDFVVVLAIILVLLVIYAVLKIFYSVP